MVLTNKYSICVPSISFCISQFYKIFVTAQECSYGQCDVILVSLEHSTILTYGNVQLLSVINGQHDELDFDFPVDGEVFSRLYYLVEGIYPQLLCFLSLESNSHTKLAQFCRRSRSTQKGYQTRFWTPKIKIPCTLTPNNSS